MAKAYWIARIDVHNMDGYKEYVAQKAILADVDAGKLPVDELLARGDELLQERLGNLVPAKA